MLTKKDLEKKQKIESQIERIPLSEFTVGDLWFLKEFNKEGIGADKSDWRQWEEKIKAWQEKVEREGRGPHILKDRKTPYGG